MDRFIARFGDQIIGVLSGFDRLVFRGSLRQIAFVSGLMGFLWKRKVLLKDFGTYAESRTEELKAASLLEARRLDRPVKYLSSGGVDKEAVARKIAAEDRIREGLIGVLTAVEPCMTYEIFRNRDLKKLQLVPRVRKCLFLYHYLIDPVFGFMNARIQTWFPFSVQICINGREWLARQMDREGLAYHRRDNCFPWIESFDRAQHLLDLHLRTAWPEALDRIAGQLNPRHGQMFPEPHLRYYWTTHQSEWATDLAFREARTLAEIYPWLIRHGIQTFSCEDVMRFLGRKPHGNFQGEVISSYRQRLEGVRLKHSVGKNSVKVYDKEGSVLRVETTIHDRMGFKVYRPLEGQADGSLGWREMRAGIADLHRRAQVSEQSNNRYLDALASTSTPQRLGQLIAKICRRTRLCGRPIRSLRPWDPEDLRLLRAIHRGEFAINGFRNRDLQPLLFDSAASSRAEARKRTARTSRLLRLLRAHSLIRKVPRTHRYTVTQDGREILSAILSAHDLSLDQLRKAS